MGKFMVMENDKKQWWFNLEANNNKTIGTSQMYTSKSNCEKGINSVRDNCDASIVDITQGDSDSGSRYEMFEGSDNQYYFRLIASNGEKILKSEGYTKKTNCKNGINSVRDNALNAEIVYK